MTAPNRSKSALALALAGGSQPIEAVPAPRPRLISAGICSEAEANRILLPPSSRSRGRGERAAGPDLRLGSRSRRSHAPVSPVLSGRDQASPIPSIAVSHPLTGAGAQKNIMRIWQLHDYLFVKPRREQWVAGGPREPFMFSGPGGNASSSAESRRADKTRVCRRAQLPELSVERLALRAHAGIAEPADLLVSFGHILRQT
jgi:hypothetical protein